MTGYTGFLVLTGCTILEFTGLLQLTVWSILLGFTECIVLRTSTRRTELLELTGRKGLSKATVRISAGSAKSLELTGSASVLKLTRSSGLSGLTGHIILLKLTERTSLRASTDAQIC